MVHSVEKASLEKIQRLLEISEQESHYEVLLTLKNLANVRWNPAPYNLPIIPHPLPLDIVDREHFITADLLNLTVGGASSSKDMDAETSSRELVSRTSSRSSTFTSGGSGSTQHAPSWGKRGSHPKSLPLLRKGTRSAPRILKIKKGGTNQQHNALGAQVKYFVPWVRPESSWPSDLEEEEEEEEMVGLLDCYVARKQKRQESSEREPDQIEGLNQSTTYGDSEMQAIVIPSSPEMGSSDQPGPEDVALGEPREVTPIPPALQVIHPPDRAESRSNMPKLARTGPKRSLLPYRILLNSYLPPRGPAPVMEEVAVPGPEDIKHIIHRWKPFNQGESTADRLDDLYPRILRMPVASRVDGLGEEYSVVVPAGIIKEDLQQIIEDGMQVHNRKYVQSTELVR